MKFVLILLMTSLSYVAFSQNALESANKPLSTAEKAAIDLVKTYNLTGEQALEAKKIQQEKYKALAKIEALKNQDLQKYIVKKLSAYETADNALMVLLDEQQMAVFKKKQMEKSIQYENIVTAMKKKGVSQSDIDKKLSELEF